MAITKKKKKFFEIEIPLINKTAYLQAFEQEELEGKYIEYDLTRILRGKNAILKNKVEIKDKKLTSIPLKLVIMPSYMKRMMKKGTNYVEDSFTTNSKDSQIRIKPFLITRRKVSRAVRKALREKTKQELINFSKSKTSKQIFDEVLTGKLQKYLSMKLKKIYPLSLCEIKTLKIEKFLAKPTEITKEKPKDEIKEVIEIKSEEKSKEETKEKKKKE